MCLDEDDVEGSMTKLKIAIRVSRERARDERTLDKGASPTGSTSDHVEKVDMIDFFTIHITSMRHQIYILQNIIHKLPARSRARRSCR